MSYCVLWIDQDHAKIFNFLPEGEKFIHLANEHHFNHHTGHWENEKLENQKKFYKEVEEKLVNNDKILVIGPSRAKDDFKRYLEEHAEDLADSIIGMQTVDKLTDGQIRDYAKKYFHRFNLFEAQI